MARKRYDEDFKKQLVKIYNQGNHSYRSLGEEYDVAGPTIRTWVIRYNESESFNINDNRTKEEKELIELKKKVKQLEMENDILSRQHYYSAKSRSYYF